MNCINCHQDDTTGRSPYCPACRWERTKNQKKKWRRAHDRRSYDHHYNTTHRKQRATYMRQYRARAKQRRISTNTLIHHNT